MMNRPPVSDAAGFFVEEHMDEDLIVLGAQAETPAAGGEDSQAAGTEPEVVETHGADTTAEPGSGAAPAEPAPKPEAPKGEGDGEGDAERPKKRSGIARMQDRISRLEAELTEARKAAPAAGGDRAAAIEKEIGAPPKEADFDDYLAYERALRQYDVKHALADQRHADREASVTDRQARARQEAIEAFEDRMDTVRGKIPDFDAVIASAKQRPVKEHVSDLVVDSEKGGLLAYYLAKNPAELAKLNGMSPLQAAKAVGALEHRLTLAKPKTATTAPAPAKPVSGSAKPASPDSDLDAWLAKKYG